MVLETIAVEAVAARAAQHAHTENKPSRHQHSCSGSSCELEVRVVTLVCGAPSLSLYIVGDGGRAPSLHGVRMAVQVHARRAVRPMLSFAAVIAARVGVPPG